MQGKQAKEQWISRAIESLDGRVFESGYYGFTGSKYEG